MFPEPKDRPTPELRATAEATSERTGAALRVIDPREPETALRIGPALIVARSQTQDEPDPDAQQPAGNWIVKAVPRPPLVAAMLQEPPADELLDNDSPGG